MKFDLRGSPRLRLKRSAPALTRFGPVQIVDLTPTGLGVTHLAPMERGEQTWLELTWAGRPLHLQCEVRVTRRGTEDPRYRTGLAIRGGASADEYRQLVEREIEKMKAAQAERPPVI